MSDLHGQNLAFMVYSIATIDGNVYGPYTFDMIQGWIRESGVNRETRMLRGDIPHFPKTGTSTARDIAERLRKIISDRQFPYEDAQPVGELTVSIGIATFPDDALDWSTLISNADRALYKAKADGRNNVVVFTSIEPPNIPG